MKFRGLFLALLVLAALTGALYWSNRSSSAKTPEAAPSPSPKILALNQDDGCWRVHSWSFDGERVVETTETRSPYFGRPASDCSIGMVSWRSISSGARAGATALTCT